MFIGAERAVARPVEGATHSDEFAGTLAAAARLASGLRAAYLRATANALHRANLPAWSDLRELTEQLTGLERRVADLAMELERDRSRTRSVRRPSSRRQPPASDQ